MDKLIEPLNRNFELDLALRESKSFTHGTAEAVIVKVLPVKAGSANSMLAYLPTLTKVLSARESAQNLLRKNEGFKTFGS